MNWIQFLKVWLRHAQAQQINVFKHIFANRFRSTTLCHHRTYVARCTRYHRSIVARLQATELRLATLGFASQPEQVVLLVLAQPIVLPLVQVEPVQLALVGMSFDWSAWTLRGIAEASRSVNTRYTAVLFIGS